MTENNSKSIQSYTCLLVDLDDTLYHHENGAWEMIRARIDRFMIEEMGFSPQDVPSIRQRLWEQYGTTLRGLQTEFSVDMDTYLDFVHNVPLEKIIAPEPALDNLFTILPHQKHIFTNAHAVHARRVLSLLGISQHFENIIDIFAIQPYCKPQAEAFKKALAIIEEDPRNCLLIDDSPNNLDTAQTLGMGTVSVGKHRHNGSPHINQILELSLLLSNSS